MADFLTEIMAARKERNDTFCGVERMKDANLELFTRKIFLQKESQIKTFTDKKLRKSASRSALQEILKVSAPHPIDPIVEKGNHLWRKIPSSASIKLNYIRCSVYN